MNWKTRQLFSDREHGIVSGLSPVNMMGGGSVPMPGYKHGGTVGRAGAVPLPYNPLTDTSEPIKLPYNPLDRAEKVLFEGATEAPEEPSIEQRVAELAAQQGISVPEARATILTQMIQEKGLTLSGEVINQFATGVITLQDALAQAQAGIPRVPGMQDGGVALDLFEEGDQDINEALNMMSGSVSPPLSDVGPTAPTGATETIEETVTVTEDQGSGEYEVELQELKEGVRNEIRSYVSEGGSGDLEEYLGQMSVVYGNQLDELKRKYGVTEYTPEEELITADFMSELESLASIPGFQSGGVNIFDETVVAGMDDATLQTALNSYFEGKQPVNAKLWRQTASEGRKVLAIRILGGGAGAGTGNSLADALATLKQERMDLVPELGRAAGAAYKTKEGGWGGLLGKLQAQKAGETLAKDKILAEQTALLSRLSGSAGGPTSIMDSLTADQSNIITGANANKLELQRLKNKQSAWTDMLSSATETMAGTNAVMRALKSYILLYNYPPEGLFGATGSDWEGTRMGADGQPITWEEYNTRYLKDIEDEATYKNVLTAWLTLDRVEE